MPQPEILSHVAGPILTRSGPHGPESQTQRCRRCGVVLRQWTSATEPTDGAGATHGRFFPVDSVIHKTMPGRAYAWTAMYLGSGIPYSDCEAKTDDQSTTDEAQQARP